MRSRRAGLLLACSLSTLCCVLAAEPLAAPARAALAQDKGEKETLAEARAALTAKDPQRACDVITAYLTRAVGTLELEEVLGQALLQLGRNDEAAHHLELALKQAGDNEAEQRQLKASLSRADPLYTRRAALMAKTSKELLDVCQKLYATGHTERALALLTALEPIASGAEKQTIGALAAKIRSAKEEVHLDSESDEAAGTAHPLVDHEGAHYILHANLEPATVQRVSDVMDDVFNYYVQVYFDGDITKVQLHKPGIRIYPTHAEMVQHWDGPPGVGGWWSPGDWTVNCYDTRTDRDGGTLDQMLLTLFHEASHHFMSMLDPSNAMPAWINEGTATFFEGATAMADRHVLWPDAASGRLAELHWELTQGRGPTVAQVISFNEGGSYAAEYYGFGWGLVYYLQQYEDPETFQYVYRPLYAAYRETIARKGGEPMALFKEIFLAQKAPGGAKDFDAWVARWRTWILGEVYPLHAGANRRELRLAKAKAYIAAADRAKSEKGAKVPESELLTRALGQLEFILKKIDPDTSVDVDLVVLQADVLERLGRPQGTAALLESVLDRADNGETTLDPQRYEELEKRLSKLDAKNQALHVAKARANSFSKQALKLLDDYQAAKLPMTLTAYEVARLLADALESKPLKESAGALRAKARDSGLLHGALYRIGGRPSAWVSIFDNAEEVFDAGESKLTISGVRPVGRVFNVIPISGEYELRCTLSRVGEISRTTFQGVVFSGTLAAQWFVAGIDGKGQLVLRRYEKGGSERTLKVQKLEPEVGPDESPAFAVHVLPDDRVVIRVGERAPIEIALDEPLPKTSYVGVFSKYGRTELDDLVLEVFP